MHLVNFFLFATSRPPFVFIPSASLVALGSSACELLGGHWQIIPQGSVMQVQAFLSSSCVFLSLLAPLEAFFMSLQPTFSCTLQ